MKTKALNRRHHYAVGAETNSGCFYCWFVFYYYYYFCSAVSKRSSEAVAQADKVTIQPKDEQDGEVMWRERENESYIYHKLLRGAG